MSSLSCWDSAVLFNIALDNQVARKEGLCRICPDLHLVLPSRRSLSEGWLLDWVQEVDTCQRAQLKGMILIAWSLVMIDNQRDCLNAHTSLFTTHDTHRSQHERFRHGNLWRWIPLSSRQFRLWSHQGILLNTKLITDFFMQEMVKLVVFIELFSHSTVHFIVAVDAAVRYVYTGKLTLSVSKTCAAKVSLQKRRHYTVEMPSTYWTFKGYSQTAPFWGTPVCPAEANQSNFKWSIDQLVHYKTTGRSSVQSTSWSWSMCRAKFHGGFIIEICAEEFHLKGFSVVGAHVANWESCVCVKSSESAAKHSRRFSGSMIMWRTAANQSLDVNAVFCKCKNGVRGE